MPVRYNGHQLDRTPENMHTLVIDYLILNFKGTLTENKNSLEVYKNSFVNPFTLISHEYGNKTFKLTYDLVYNNEKVAKINTVPRSSILASDLIQIQFENHLFYTLKLNDISQLIYKMTDYFNIQFEGINRLDVALDSLYNYSEVQGLANSLLNGSLKIKGREKSFNTYYTTKQGNTVLNGFTIGKRSSSRYLRVYNKTLSLVLDKTPKTYILDFHKKNGLESTGNKEVWRFEYQLNASFFTYLKKIGQSLTYQIFCKETLINLLQLAERNHFEVVHNTGKKETNKEKTFNFIDWQSVITHTKTVIKDVIIKLKKPFETSSTIHKRLIKSLLREYYISPDTSYLYIISKILYQNNLINWFSNKIEFYFYEFINKEKLLFTFDYELFNNEIRHYLNNETI